MFSILSSMACRICAPSCKRCRQVVSAELLQGASLGYKLSAAKLKICRYDDGSEGSPLPGSGNLIQNSQ